MKNRAMHLLKFASNGVNSKSETSKDLPVSLLSTFIQKQKSKLYHGAIEVGP